MQFRLFFISLFLVSVVTFSAGIARVGSILWGDTRYYYAYTRSLVMDHDINFVNEAFRPGVGYPHPPEISTSTLRVTNKFSPGAPVLWIPGFVIGQVVSWFAELPVLVRGGGWPSPDGYSMSTQYVVALSAIVMAVGGLAVTFDALRKWLHARYGLGTARAARWSLAICAALYGSTQLLYYTSIDPLNSHSASFLVSALALWITVRAIEQGWNWQRALLLGLVGGVLFLIRAQDVLVVAPSLLFMMAQPLLATRAAARQLGPRQFSWQSFGLGVLAALPLLAALAIQQVVVWYLFGQFGSPYLLRGEAFSWLRPNFVRVLLSPGNGLFFFAPLTAAMVYGLYRLTRGGRNLGAIALGVFLLQLYVIAAWGPEIVGGPYGSRMFVSSLPWLAVGLAPIGEHVMKLKRWQWWLWGGLSLAFANNLVQTVVMLVRF